VVVGVGGVVQVEMMPTGVQGVVAVERAEVSDVVGEVRVVAHVMTVAATAEEDVVSVNRRDVVVVGNCGVMAVGKEATADAGVAVGGRQGQVAASRERRVDEVRLLRRGRG
jgi:pantothenate kinase